MSEEDVSNNAPDEEEIKSDSESKEKPLKKSKWSFRAPFTWTWEKLKAGPNKSFRDWIEVLKICIEIIAIIVAGLWVYTRFFSGEAPSLEERGQITSDFQWIKTKNSQCTGTMSITVKNIGKKSIDIDSIDLRAWLVPRPSVSEDSIIRLSPENLIANNKAIFSQEIKEGGITGHYPPDYTLHDDYVFLIPNIGEKEDRIAVFQFEGHARASDDKNKVVPLSEYRWSGNCEAWYGDEIPSPTTAAFTKNDKTEVSSPSPEGTSKNDNTNTQPK
jgi:hypothetical protein